MPRKHKDNGEGQHGHRGPKQYVKSSVVGGGSSRAIKRNQVRRMAEDEGMALRTAWRLLKTSSKPLGIIASLVKKYKTMKRKKRQKAQKLARRKSR